MLRLAREPPGAVQKGDLDPVADRQGVGQRLAAGQLIAGERASQLQQSQRVAPGVLDERGAHRGGHRCPRRLGEKFHAGLFRQPGDDDLGHSRQLEPIRSGLVAHGEEEGDRVGETADVRRTPGRRSTRCRTTGRRRAGRAAVVPALPR